MSTCFNWQWVKIRPGKYEVQKGRLIIGYFRTERDADRLVQAGRREIRDE